MTGWCGTGRVVKTRSCMSVSSTSQAVSEAEGESSDDVRSKRWRWEVSQGRARQQHGDLGQKSARGVCGEDNQRQRSRTGRGLGQRSLVKAPYLCHWSKVRPSTQEVHARPCFLQNDWRPWPPVLTQRQASIHLGISMPLHSNDPLRNCFFGRMGTHWYVGGM